MSKNIKTRIQNKHDIEVNWQAAKNFVPLVGEIIVYDPDTNHTAARFKIGDGKTLVNDLPFADAVGMIGAGTEDPNAATAGQFYFKYSTQ